MRLSGRFGWARIRRFSLFAIVPFFGFLSPLLVIPAVTSEYGAVGWAAMAIGQSTGGAAAVLVELAWGLTGPQLVAATATRERASVFALSTISKSVVAVPAMAVAAVVAASISQSFAWESAIMAAASAVLGLSPAWYFTGTGHPLRILVTDSIPKLIAAAVASALLLGGLPLIWYPISFFVASIASPLIGAIIAKVGLREMRAISIHLVWDSIRAQLLALSGRAASSVYLALPTVLLAIVSPSAVASFAAADRLQRMVLAILSSVPNSMQRWIGASTSNSEVRRRLRISVALNSAFGLVAGTTFSVLAPWGAAILFTGEVPVPFSLTAICGWIIFITCTSRATGGLGLVATKKIGWLTISAVTGAAIGVASIVFFGSLFGDHGAMLGMACAESAVLIVQLFGLRSRGGTRPQLRQDPKERPSRSDDS